MSRFVAHLGLPLLTKELIEQSARKRTYIVRVLYAIALYGTTLWAFQQQLGSWNAAGFEVLGKGRSLYTSLAWLEFAGIYIFLPAMTCGVLTAEKERDTLGLLLLTKLGSWTIVFEKLFGRLVPMASFVLLSLPLLAVAYSLGGVESADIAKLMWVLAMTALQVGAFAVLCSAWFRTTAGAFLATYLLGTLAIFISGILCAFVCRWWHEFVFQVLLSSPAYQWLVNSIHLGNPHTSLLVFGPFIVNGGELLTWEGSGIAILREQTFLDCLVMTLPLMGMSALSLTLARAILWRRAFVQPRNVLLKLFKSLDGFFQRVNHNRLTRGIVLIRESVALPLYHPISWRETAKRSLGTTRYLVRFLLLLEVPVVVMVLWPAGANSLQSGLAPAYITEWTLWLVATLVLAIQSTGLIGTERTHQTLDVLLTTPLESDEIVRQKFAGTWRMIHMLWVPFATLYVFQIWWATWVTFAMSYDSTHQAMFMVIRGILAVSLYLPTIAWFGFHQGLRRRSQTQAILVTMTTITIICVVPPAMGWFLAPPPVFQFNYGPPVRTWIGEIGWISPAAVLASRPSNELDWFLLVVHFGGVAAVYLWLAYSARKAFAKRVGRNDGDIVDEEELPVAALTLDERLARLRRGRIGARATDDLDSTDGFEKFRNV